MRKIKLGFWVIFLIIIFQIRCISSTQQPVVKVTSEPEKAKLEIHVINVGQGDSFLIISPSGKRVLIDAGNTGRGEETVFPYLQRHGIASNGFILSGQVYSGKDENALSVVLVLRFHSFDMYFGGDSNSAIEPFLATFAGDVDVYKVSHHGSTTSSCQQLLDCLKPEVSIITVGNSNTYGHPSSETISRLASVNSFIYQTESGATAPHIGKGEVVNGSFTITTDGDSYTISGASLLTWIRLTDSNLSKLREEIESFLRFWPF